MRLCTFLSGLRRPGQPPAVYSVIPRFHAGLGAPRSQACTCLAVVGLCHSDESAAGGRRRNLAPQGNDPAIRGQIPQSRRWRVARSG